MKKHEIFFGIIKVPLDFIIIFLAFFIARDIRLVTDFIPGIILPIKTIDNKNLFNFAIIGSLIYIFIFAIHRLYSLKITHSKIKEIADIIRYSIYWMIGFSALVYFAKDFAYKLEIPRLIIFFTFIITVISIIIERFLLNFLQAKLMSLNILSKRKIIIITNQTHVDIKEIIDDIEKTGVYKIIGYINTCEIKNSQLNFLGDEKNIKDIITNYGCDEILNINSDFNKKELYKIWEYSRILGVKYKYITNFFDITKNNTSISLMYKIPTIEIKNTNLDTWYRVLKRSIDIIFSFFGLIILSPAFLLVGILIKIDDPKGPVFYKNKRVGQNGKSFILYKFRYMKWDFCIKDSYGVRKGEDKALDFEKKLIKEKSTRKGPLYKIENDPRKTKIGTFIEKYSIDEFPQFLNVLIGNMSLVGPRPHQPREVNKYKDIEKRVLTIKPGITGMSQVNGRENNKFENEVKLDIFYIENWSFLLDFKILFKTIGTVLRRR